MMTSISRSRWAAFGAAVAVALGAGTIGLTHATEPAGATTYVPITPCRLLDTRPLPDNVGNRDTPIGPGTIHTVSAHGNNGSCTGIPATATGLSLNITALNATAASFLTIWPTGAPQPFTANLNPTPGEPPTPNAVTTGLSVSGQFDIFNAAGNVDVVVDVFGFYTDHQHTGADIVDGSITGADIADGTLTNVDTSNEPGIVTDFSTTLVNPLPLTATTVASVSMRAPSNGFVKIEVTGEWINGSLASVDAVQCQLQKGEQTGINLSLPHFALNERTASDATEATAFSAHRIVSISSTDNPLSALSGQPLRMTCVETAGDVRFDDVLISGTFYPSSYAPVGFISILEAEAID